MKKIWEYCSDNIKFKNNKEIIFSDSLDHWNNGVLRLLNITEEKAKSWIEFLAEDDFNSDINKSILRTNIFFNVDKSFYTTNSSEIIVSNIDGNPDLYIRSNGFGRYSELFSKKTGKKSKPPEYEEIYFEGNDPSLGYGDLSAQSPWRLEKAWRYYHKLMHYIKLDVNGEVKLNKILDIGSGYGFMRKPFIDNNIDNHGIEISKHAIKVSKILFDIDTLSVDISELSDKYDCILAYDLIEHIENLEEYIIHIKRNLNKGGYFVIRTPNLCSIEFFMFGNMYHSLKKEHLNYFTVQDLIFFLQKNGFKIQHIETESHLLDGFKFFDKKHINFSNLGSDIYCIAKMD